MKAPRPMLRETWILFAIAAVGFLAYPAAEARQQTREPRSGSATEPAAVSQAQEVVVGNRALSLFLDQHPLSPDGNLHVRVGDVGRRVARISDRPGVVYRFHVIRGEDLQAYAFPGGSVCITEGLARGLSDDELAFALGHELAHIALRHHVENYRRYVRAYRKKPPEQAMLDAIMKRFDRDQAIEADRYGALYALRAGYRFSAAEQVLKTLARASRAQADSTPPPFADRIPALAAFRKELERSLDGFHAATDALAEGEIEAAIERLLIFVAQFPYSSSGHVNLGAAYLARVRRTAPLEVAEVLPILPHPGRILRGSYDRADLEQAREQFRIALRIEPDEAYALAGLALVNLRLGEVSVALGQLDRAHELAPNSPEILLCLGNARFHADETELAEIHYQAALALRPAWGAARKNLGILYERQGRIEKARAIWEALAADPDFREEAAARLRRLRDAS